MRLGSGFAARLTFTAYLHSRLREFPRHGTAGRRIPSPQQRGTSFLHLLTHYSPSSPPPCCLVKAFISCSLILIFPDFSICSRRFAINSPNNSDCLLWTKVSRI